LQPRGIDLTLLARQPRLTEDAFPRIIRLLPERIVQPLGTAEHTLILENHSFNGAHRLSQLAMRQILRRIVPGTMCHSLVHPNLYGLCGFVQLLYVPLNFGTSNLPLSLHLSQQWHQSHIILPCRIDQAADSNQDRATDTPVKLGMELAGLFGHRGIEGDLHNVLPQIIISENGLCLYRKLDKPPLAFHQLVIIRQIAAVHVLSPSPDEIPGSV